MKIKEFHDLTKEEVELKLRELGDTIFKMRSQRVTGQLENPGKIRQVKRDIARAKTILKELESQGK